MIKKQCYWLAPLLALFVGLPLRAAEKKTETINLTDINKIKAEGVQHSQVMELNSWLSDVYGPRLTGSPAIEQAADWAMGKMKQWGLVNVKKSLGPIATDSIAAGPTTSSTYRPSRRRNSPSPARRWDGRPARRASSAARSLW